MRAKAAIYKCPPHGRCSGDRNVCTTSTGSHSMRGGIPVPHQPRHTRSRANVNAICYATIVIACYKMRGQTVCGLEWRCQSAIYISRERLATCLRVSLPGIGSVSFGNDRRLFAAPFREHGNNF